MSDSNKKTVSRVLSQSEARYLFDLFEQVHCFKQNEKGEVIATCPGWSWELESLDENNQPQKGGCRYKNANKLCTNLQTAANGMLVVDIRPKNEDDVSKEREQERAILEQELRRLKNGKMGLEEQILALENKMRNL